MNTSVIERFFKVKAELRHGEEVRICGAIPSLGCNDPMRAVPMYTSTVEYPYWKTKDAILLPGDAGSVIYRYCVFSGGKFSRWEGNGNISRSLAEAGKVDVFGAPYEIISDSEENGVASPLAPKSFRSLQLAEWSNRLSAGSNLSPSDGVIIVSYILPVFLTKSANGQWSAAWDSENILALSLNMRVSWVGSVRYAGGPIPTEDEEAVCRVLLEKSCYPIFISQSTHHQFYDIFCKQNLWLLMHHVADVYGPLKQSEIGAKGQQDLWFTYSTVNRLFRDKVIELYHQGDLIWIHGFHFMLLPTILRRNLQFAKIGYFFHTPFPSSEIWRTITRREDLIRGILGADHIGFHLYEYARHFRSVCHRVLGYTSDMTAAGKLAVNVDGREVAITCIHVGVDLPRVQMALASDSFIVEFSSWRRRFRDKIVISGIDRLERLKGIPLKLRAIEEFMSENPQWRGRLLFPILGIGAAERGDDYKQTQRDVRALVAELNLKYGAGETDPVVLFQECTERELRLPQRLAFFAASDILLSTAARDGLNRLPMEFTLAKQRAQSLNLFSDLSGTPTPPLRAMGLVIISEFISSARVMRGALIVNPWKAEEVKNALTLALEMSESGIADRARRNLEFSTRLTTERWAIHVLDDLKSVEKQAPETSENFTVGFGMGFRVMGVRAGFQPLDMVAVSKAYRAAKTRVIVMDWGGTLVAENDKVDKLHAYAVAKGHARRAGPTSELKDALEMLCADMHNIVFVVSGKELRAVSEFFGDVDGLGLGAEHGFYYRWPDDAQSTKWRTVQAVGDTSWMEAAQNVMNVYVQRTHGTYIEVKGTALIWQFRDADPEFGLMQSKELEEHLKAVLQAHPVEVIRGGGVNDGYIEVRLAGVSKGFFLQHLLEKVRQTHREVGFVLAVGDDSSDEPMFQQIALMQSSAGAAEDIALFSVSVGKKPTAAHAYVDDPAGVLDLIGTLNRASLRVNEAYARRVFSVHDLPSFPVAQQSVPRSFSSNNVLADNQQDRTVKFATSPPKELSPLIIDATNELKSTLLDSPTSSILRQSTKSYGSHNHLNATEYFQSINEANQEQDDAGGIYF